MKLFYSGFGFLNNPYIIKFSPLYTCNDYYYGYIYFIISFGYSISNISTYSLKDFSNKYMTSSVTVFISFTNVYFPFPYSAIPFTNSSSKLLPIPNVNILLVFLSFLIFSNIVFVSYTYPSVKRYIFLGYPIISFYFKILCKV